jgi:hypothetical protein
MKKKIQNAGGRYCVANEKAQRGGNLNILVQRDENHGKLSTKKENRRRLISNNKGVTRVRCKVKQEVVLKFTDEGQKLKEGLTMKCSQSVERRAWVGLSMGSSGSTNYTPPGYQRKHDTNQPPCEIVEEKKDTGEERNRKEKYESVTTHNEDQNLGGKKNHSGLMQRAEFLVQ